MIYIFLCILSATGIFIVFRYISKYNISSLPVIVINYFIASGIGFLLRDKKYRSLDFVNSQWIIPALIIGVLFILLFFVISRSTSEAGISVTTVASKMSVVFPISFSILQDPNDHLGFLKLAGILLAVFAVILTLYNGKKIEWKNEAILYPAILFIGMGFVDSMVKYSQYNYLSDDEHSYFTAVLFLISFLSGLVFILFKKKDLVQLVNLKVISWGILLGTVNFGSIYFLLKALSHINSKGVKIDSSIVFGINNTGIVLLSVLAGVFLFREKLSRTNKLGIAFSIMAIIIFVFA